MRLHHPRPVVNVLSALGALACAFAAPAALRGAHGVGVEPLPQPAEAPTPPADAPESSAPAAASPAASPSPAAATAGSAVPGVPVPDGVEVRYDDSQKITWYSPKLDPWRMFDFRIYPSI